MTPLAAFARSDRTPGGGAVAEVFGSLAHFRETVPGTRCVGKNGASCRLRHLSLKIVHRFREIPYATEGHRRIAE